LLTRDDRDDAEYLELASRYPSATVLAAFGPEAVLVAPAWVLTSAKNAKLLQARDDATVLVGGKPRRVASVTLHPEARDGTPADLALIRLRDGVADVTPSRLYRNDDEADKGIVVVAHGATGRIGQTARKQDGKVRAAINTVERVSSRSLHLKIKSPDDASDLQGMLLPGEEGAPAYLETPEGIFVAGLYYGDEKGWNLLSRLSAFVPWVEATMVGSERDAVRRMLGDEAR
jgi:hypothetical protein